MSSCHFNFPPQSFSALYKPENSTTLDANKLYSNGCEGCETPISPASVDAPTTLFSCFHCAFRKSIKVIQKEKHRKDKHAVNTKAITATPPRTLSF